MTDADQGSATSRAIDLQYDSVYNRTVWTDTLGGINIGYQDNALHQYTQVGAVTPTYDSKGNITSGYGGGLTLVYDCENRLTTAGSVSYAYDWLGRRVSRTVSGGTTTCVYDGGQIIAEYNGGTLLRKYIYGPGIDEPACMVASGGTYYYHFDGLGSVAALTDSGGTLVEKYRYDAFGATTILAPNNQTRTTSLYGNRFMFTGREWDSTTQLYHYRARDYSPALGRFLQPDPIGYADSMNLYQYCGNNPTNWIDPWGLEFTWYGNWGGPGWTGGYRTGNGWPTGQGQLPDYENMTPAQRGLLKDPVDPFDKKYKKHDLNYARNRENNLNSTGKNCKKPDQKAYGNQQAKDDLTLAGDLLGAQLEEKRLRPLERAWNLLAVPVFLTKGVLHL